MKHIGIILTKDTKEFYSENYKIPLKETEECILYSWIIILFNFIKIQHNPSVPEALGPSCSMGRI